MSNGKGDTPRPLSIPLDVFKDNFERTFGRKQEPAQDLPPTEQS